MALAPVCAGCAINLLAGLPYAFGAYCDDLKRALALSQRGAAGLGISLDLGLYLAQPLAGSYFDARGTRPTLGLAALALATGYGALALALAHAEAGGAPTPYALLAGAFALAGAGGAFAAIATVGTNVKLAPARTRTAVLSAHSVAFALSPLAVIPAYARVSRRGAALSRFFGATACAASALVGLGGCVLDWAARAADAPPGELEAPPSCAPPARDARHALRRALADRRWRALEAAAFCAFGCGLFAANNLQPLVRAAGGGAAECALATAIYPLCNAAGRLSLGVASMARGGGRASRGCGRVRRGYWLALALLTMAVAYAGAALVYGASVPIVHALLAAVAFAYGLAWVALQASLTDLSELSDLGAMLGLLAMTAGVAGSAANALGAALYDAALRPGERVCVGGRCFRRALAAASLVALCGLVAALELAPATRRTDGRDAGGGGEAAQDDGKMGEGGSGGDCALDELADSELAGLVGHEAGR